MPRGNPGKGRKTDICHRCNERGISPQNKSGICSYCSTDIYRNQPESNEKKWGHKRRYGTDG